MVAVGQIPPHDIRAEQAALGSMIMDFGSRKFLAGQLQADDFYRSAHKHIFSALCETSVSDEITLADYLQGKGLLERVGGKGYIWSLIQSLPSSALDEQYARIVKSKAVARKGIEATLATLEDFRDSAPEEALAKALTRLKGLAETFSECKFATMSEAIDAWKNQPRRAGHPTGLIDLDRAMNGGYHPGGITLIGGDSGSGKTVLALQAARTAVQNFTPTLVISRDQRWFDLAARMWSAEAGIPRPFLQDDEGAIRIEPLVRGWDLFWYRGQFKAANVTAGIKIAVASHGVNFWVLDYLQRVACPAERITQAPVLVAEALADVAQDTNTYGVVISRVTKPMTGVAIQHRLAGEAGVQNAADTMMFVHKIGDGDDIKDMANPRYIQVVGKRHCGDSKLLVFLEGHLDRYRDATIDEKTDWRQK